MTTTPVSHSSSPSTFFIALLVYLIGIPGQFLQAVRQISSKKLILCLLLSPSISTPNIIWSRKPLLRQLDRSFLNCDVSDVLTSLIYSLPHQFSKCSFSLGPIRSVGLPKKTGFGSERIAQRQAVYLCLTCPETRGVCSGD